MLFAEAVPQGTAVCAAGQEHSRAWDPSGLGRAPYCCQDFRGFCPAKGENKTQRQLLHQGILAAGTMLAPWRLMLYREGDSRCPLCCCASSCNPPQAPQNPIRSQPEPVPSGREGGAKLCPVGTRRQIPIQGSEVVNPHPPFHCNSSFVLPVTCWCQVLNFSIS